MGRNVIARAWLLGLIATSSISISPSPPTDVDVLGDLAPITGSNAPFTDTPSTPTCPSAAVERYCGRELAMDNAAYLAVKRGGCTADNGQYFCPGGYVLDARTFFAVNNSACQAACSADGAALGTAQDYAWTVSEWAACPVRCGGALQTRRVGCIITATSQLVPDWYCPVETQPAAQRSCGDAPCDALDGASGTVQLGPWGDCVQGFAVRTALCVGLGMGVPVGVQACTADGSPAIQLGATTTTHIATHPHAPVCPGMLAKPCTVNGSIPTWRLGEWSPCSAQCGGGSRTRTVECVHPPTSRVLPASACDRPTTPRPPSTSTCNTAPCIAYTYRVGPWSACSARCGGGTRNRTVECVDPSGAASTDCRGILPPAQQRCNEAPCVGACGHCSGHGRCADATSCRCEGGWSGRACDVPPSTSACAGRVDASGACCEGGRVDVDGRCCAGGHLDGQGRCCTSGVDACGVCGGQGMLDVEGRCCVGGVLDAGGLCCEGVLDECGVCDGDGRSCDVVAVVRGGGPFATARQMVLEAVTIGLSSDGAVLGSQPAVQTSLLLRVAEMGAAARAALQVQAITRRAVCGNGFCEVDEVVECPGDCPLPWRACDCKGGGCLFGAGACVCWTGYEGDACERCAPGFARDAGGACSFVVAAGGGRGSQSAGGGGTVVALGVAVGVLGVVAVAACTALVVLARRRKPVRYRRRRASSVRAVMALRASHKV